jgi:hypothetical protein
VFSQKVMELIKYNGDKGRTYERRISDVISLDWGINNYDVYNKMKLLKR